MKPVLLMRVIDDESGCVWEIFDCGQDRIMEVESHD